MKYEESERAQQVEGLARELRLRVEKQSDNFVRLVDTMTAEVPYVHYWSRAHLSPNERRDELFDVARKMRGHALLQLLVSEYALDELDEGQTAQIREGLKRLGAAAGASYDEHIAARIATWVQKAGKKLIASDEDEAMRDALADGIRAGVWRDTATATAPSDVVFAREVAKLVIAKSPASDGRAAALDESIVRDMCRVFLRITEAM